MSTTPNEESGLSVRSAAAQIEGLLDGDGHYNPTPDRISRGHPDYSEGDDTQSSAQERDERGRFKRNTPAEEATATADREEVEEKDEPNQDDTPLDTDDTVSDTDGDQTLSADSDADAETADTDDIRTLSDLAAALEVPLDDLQSTLTHSFRAADEDVTVTLAELEKGYQKEADYRRSTAKLADEKRAIERDYQTKMQEFDQHNVQLSQQMAFTEQLLVAELQDPQLAELQTSSPAEWTARSREIEHRLLTLRNARMQAAAQYDQQINQFKTELRQRELAMLTEAVPDWSSEHQTLARDTMQSLGYSDTELAEVFDHRAIKGALELAALRKEVEELRALQSKAKDTVKRVKKEVPKLQKPGKPAKTSGISRDNVQRLKERARKSGRVEDAAKVIESMII